jgi:hypothetical protein
MLDKNASVCFTENGCHRYIVSTVEQFKDPLCVQKKHLFKKAMGKQHFSLFYRYLTLGNLLNVLDVFKLFIYI